MTKQIEIPSGTIVRVGYQTPTENLEMSGEFAGFVPVGQAMFLCLQNVGLDKITQLMIPLHLVSLLQFEVKLANLKVI